MNNIAQEIAELFGDVAPYTGPTTDQMDGLFTDEDIAEKYNAYAQCNKCFGWTYIIGTRESYGMITSVGTCEHCGEHSFDPQSVISKRTFSPENAKRRVPKGIKKKR